MIKINLLDSVSERSQGAAVVEQRVANPNVRVWIMAVSVFALMFLVMVFDYVSATAANASAKAELERQQQIAAQMAAINAEQAELEKKLNAIKTRINAIKQLRASQQGPVSLLSDVNARIPADPAFRLESVEQKGGELVIEGQSPNEQAVTNFGRSLEFSNGLFMNVSMETERKDMEIKAEDFSAADGPLDLTIKPETVKFKIKCKYAPSSPQPAPQPTTTAGKPAAPPANQVAQK
ncbi:MAG: PilN domain-containing protein [Rubrivivax sp.]|nr:PilN domain-containing protein [Pyrinomonadaceae bacterium]